MILQRSDFMEFTSEQKKVLDCCKQRLLVSASAGSGKTATLIEKIFRLIESGEDILDQLVITFTELASGEMKSRLKDRLKQGAKDDARFREQLDKLPLSNIGTLHSFCSKTIRKYYYYLDLKPNFVVLDDVNSNFLRLQAIDNTISHYAKSEDEQFLRLSNIFDGGRRFDSLKNNVLSFYEFLCGVADKETYLKDVVLKCFNLDFDKNVAVQYLDHYLSSNLQFLDNSLKEYLEKARAFNANYYVEYIKNIKENIEFILHKSNFDERRMALNEYILPQQTRKKLGEEDSNFKEEFKNFYEILKGRLSDLKNFTLAGEKKDSLIQDLKITRDFLKKFVEVEENFENEYTRLKGKKNGLDFNDLERYFLRLMEIGEVRDSIKFSNVFVDEYQDINTVQEKILTVLARSCKMVMVGDIKQSIYGFRNSTPQIFVEKSKIYRDANLEHEIIDLNQNFRSDNAILNFVNQIFKRCMSEDFGGVDYEKQSILVGGDDYPKVDIVPKVELNIIAKQEKEEIEEDYDDVYSVLLDKNDYKTKLNNSRREGILIAKKIADLVENGYYYDNKSKSKKKIKFSDIAVISRKNEYLTEIAQVLSMYKLPISTNIIGNIYKNQDVNVLVCLLKVLNNFHDDVSLSVLLTSHFFKFSFDDLSIIRRAYDEEEYFYQSILRYSNEKMDTLASKLKQTFEVLDRLRKAPKNLYNLLMDFCKDYEYFTYLYSLPRGQNRVKNVTDFINSFISSEYNNNLYAFIDYLKNYGENSRFKSNVTSLDDNVTLCTIHASKGLEYPIVFLVGVGENFSGRSFSEIILKDKDFGICSRTYDIENFEKRENLAKNTITLYKRKLERAEELRLLYVALTRAKNHLFISGCSSLKYVPQVKSPLDAQGVHNYLGWILSFLSDINYKNLFINSKNFTQKIGNYDVFVNVYDDGDLVADFGKTNNYKLSKINANDLKESLNFSQKKQPKIALKNSVSSLLFEAENQIENQVETPKNLSIYESKRFDVDYGKIGTIYHTIMEKINFDDEFSAECFDKILSELNIEKEYLKFVSFSKIDKAVNCIKKQFKMGFKTTRELPFISYIPHNQIFENGREEKVIVQGIADLIIKDDSGYYLVDYKTTKTGNPDQLVEKYFIQLKLYKICLEKALNMHFKGVFIYSFYLDKLVKVF